MANKKILVAVSATEHALLAAETAWSIADRIGATVDALHVVDTVGAWQLLNFDRPGLMGSGVHIETHKKIIAALQSLGSTLCESYSARARGHRCNGKVILDQGDPLEVICKRAVDYDLVVVGHRPASLRQARERATSLAAGLSLDCPVPLLVVQRTPGEWLTAAALSSMDHMDRNYLRQAVRFCKDLKVEPKVVCFKTGLHEEMPAEFIQSLRQAEPELKNTPITIVPMQDAVLNNSVCKWFGNELELETSIVSGGLTIIPTHTCGDGRESFFGTRPHRYIDELGEAAILFWPEESAKMQTNEVVAEHASQFTEANAD